MTGVVAGSRSNGRLPAVFRNAMSELAGGVALVTCRVDGRLWGMTVTAFQSVSADPPVVLVSLESGTTAAGAVAVRGRFGVAVLAADQEDVARDAAERGAAKYLDPSVLDGALASLECVVIDRSHVADHTVFFGRVLAARSAGRGAPLVYHRRAYCTLAHQEDHDHAARSLPSAS
jgi:3-hydroxy-9,10-secoandrosta-1,3,5(10)-triene-9,17-dione monooxygenase reductase component